MERILLACNLTTEIATVIVILYKNKEPIFHSLDRDTDYIDIVASVLLGDTIPIYTLPISRISNNH